MSAYNISGPIFEPCGVNSYYHPVRNGVHLCGQTSTSKESQPYTALNIPAESAESARALFDGLKAIASCAEEEADFILDLQEDDDCSEDFWTNRQLMVGALRQLESSSPFPFLLGMGGAL